MDLKTSVVVEFREWQDGDEFVLGVTADGLPCDELRFPSEAARLAARIDINEMLRTLGAVDMPTRPQ